MRELVQSLEIAIDQSCVLVWIYPVYGDFWLLIRAILDHVLCHSTTFSPIF